MLRRDVDQRQPQRLGPWRGGPGPDALVEVGDGVSDDPPIGQGIAGARRGLRPVGVDAERTVGGAADVASMHE